MNIITEKNPTKLALIAGLGMFLSTLDSGIINVAIPSLINAFNSKISIVIWTVTLYTLILSASILLFGNLADRFGRLRVYQIGLILFAVSSLLCGASLSITQLIFFRALQGLSAAMMQATAIALITTRLEGKVLAKAMGIFGILLSLGPTLGPVLGGLIISSIGWRWIFWVNIPICLIGVYGCATLYRVQESLHPNKINTLNLIMLSVSLLAILMLLNQFSDHHFYMKSVAITASALLIYSFLEFKSKHPIIPYGLFKKLQFSAPMIGIFAFGGATTIAFMMPPLYFQELKSLLPWQIGLLCLATPIGLVLSSRLASRFVIKLGTHTLMLIGISMMTFALLIMTQIAINWGNVFIVCILFIYGMGGGLFQTPCYLNITSQFARERQAFITALTRMLQNLSFSLQAAGAALLISLQTNKVHNADNFLLGIQHAWWMATIITAIATFLLTMNLKREGIQS